MNTIERGAGRTVLLIHGLGGSWRSWSTILDPLSAARKVIAIDLPGHGATPAEPDSGTFDGLVGSVERYIADAGLAGVDVVGSSMGARSRRLLARLGADVLQDHHRHVWSLVEGDQAEPAGTEPKRGVANGAPCPAFRASLGS